MNPLAVKSRFRLLGCLLPIWAVSSAIAGQDVPAGDPPGSRQAIEAATSVAAAEVAGKVMRALPANAEIITVLPLFGDLDGMATATFEAALTEAAEARTVRQAGEGSDGWTSGRASADADEVMAGRVREIAASDSNGTIVWGRIRYARIDDTGFIAQTRIEVTTSDLVNGDVAVFIGDGSAPVEVATIALGLGRNWIDDPWFVPTVVSGAAAGLGLAIVIILSRRRIALGLKSRDLKN
jgi:hypothetical protein